MEPELLAILMILAFFGLLALGAHLSWTMLTLGFIFGWIGFGESIFPLTLLRFWDIIGSFSLLAIPLFIFMANVLSASGIADDLFETLYRWMGSLKGGLGIATVGTCAVLAAMVGTAGAGITIMGLIALPAMLAKGYNRNLAMGSIMGGGALGYMIPPSIMFILYGLFAGVSIGALFIGGILPGILMAFLFALRIWFRGFRKPEQAPSLTREETYSVREKLVMGRSLVMPALLVIAVLGSIYFGIATVGEAAGVGAMGAIIAALVHGQLTWKKMLDAMVSTMKTVGVIMWITLTAFTFAGVVTRLGAGEMLVDALQALELGRWGTLLAIIAILLLLGMIIDVVGLVVLTVPIFVPVIVAQGFDPLWFGIVYNVTIQIAFLSPPFGYGMFYLKAVVPADVQTIDLYRSVAPIIGLQLLAMAILMIFPPIGTYLPSLM